MTLVFVGHNFRYGLEAVMKLFLPVESFEFMQFDNSYQLPPLDCDHAILKRTVYSGVSELSADCRYDGRSFCMHDRLPIDIKDYEHACERGLCRLMYLCMQELLGITPEWGMLTGVRPVKLVSRLLAAGLSEHEITKKMSEDYFVSEKKTALCLSTYKNQQAVISGMPKNSASLYVSIPFCPSRCAYCSFVSSTVASSLKLIPEYVERLCEEISLTAALFKDSGLILDTVYFGGGTPTAISAGKLDKIMKTVSHEFDLSSLREYTVEAGRPDTIDYEKLSVILTNGGRRISVNPQTTDDSVLLKIGRKHTSKQFFESYALARSMGFGAINIDLIAGLPSDKLSGFKKSLSDVIELNPENITVHALSIKRAADIMQKSERDVSAALTKEMIEHADAVLPDFGYSPYYLYRQKNQLSNLENVGWERGGNAGIYNINMMEELQTVIAVGAGGSTKTVRSENEIERFYNPKYPLEYIKRFNETVPQRKRAAFSEIMKMGSGE